MPSFEFAITNYEKVKDALFGMIRALTLHHLQPIRRSPDAAPAQDLEIESLARDINAPRPMHLDHNAKQKVDISQIAKCKLEVFFTTGSIVIPGLWYHSQHR